MRPGLAAPSCRVLYKLEGPESKGFQVGLTKEEIRALDAQLIMVWSCPTRVGSAADNLRQLPCEQCCAIINWRQACEVDQWPWENSCGFSMRLSTACAITRRALQCSC